MKKFCLLAFLTFFPLSVFANDTSFGGSAFAPMPIKNDDVAMVSEMIVLTADAKREAWIVSCDFVFENKTDKAISFEMGMPFAVVDGEGDISVPKGEKYPKVGGAMVWDFVSKVDGKKVKTKKKKTTKNKKLPDLYYEMAYTWKISFKPNQTRKVKNTYVIAYTEDSVGQNHLDYILKTGLTWHGGKIGRSQLMVVMDDPKYVYPQTLPEYGIKTTPKGESVNRHGSKVTITWDLKDFKPTEDLHVTFHLRKHIAMNYMSEKRDFSKMSKAELRRVRNGLYAVYGYKFKDKNLQKHFSKQWYYHANPAFTPKVFDEEETAFIADVKAWEKKKK